MKKFKTKIESPPHQHMTSEMVSFHITGCKFASRIDKEIRLSDNGPKLVEYSIDVTLSWNTATFHRVNLPAVETTLETKSKEHQTTICKYINGWQNVGCHGM